ncbi:MAG TPA: MarR family transcriptional regulator [Actinomycetes bacterium]|nr:MarR family transcriptional regulator [Actinomycetes bacterium]
MRNRPDAERLAAWRALLEAHAAVTDLLERELEQERGLPLSKFEVLLELAEAPGGRMRMLELAQSVVLSKSGLSRLVDRMEEAELVRRERCPSDRRGYFAVLTERGRAVLRRAAPVHLSGIQEHFARHVADDEVQVLIDVLGKVNAAARDSGAQRECPGTIMETAGRDSELAARPVDAASLAAEAERLAAEIPALEA